MKNPIDRGVYLDIVDFNELFNTLQSEPVIVNRFDVNTVEGKTQLNDLLMTRYEGDTLDILPSCDCGNLQGEYNVGVRCPNCNGLVASITERPLESTLWLEVPRGVKGFINPSVWIILSNALTVSGFNILEWFCNPTYKSTRANAAVMRKLERFNITRSINFFHDNFDELINEIYEANLFKGRRTASPEEDELMIFIKRNREKIFSRYLPIPSRLTFIVESTATGVYADTTMKMAREAINTITSIESAAIPVSQRVREIRSVKAVSQLAEYYRTFFKDSVGTKYGWFRKHVFGSRLHFTFRAVISSLSDNHAYDELHLPWSMSVMVFKIHLTSKLLKRGFTPNECIQFLYEHTLKYHPLLDELFQELIAESPLNGIGVIFSRNPTLQRGLTY